MSCKRVSVVAGSASWDAGPPDVLAVDGLAVIGTLGFFVPAAILLGLVTFAVIRDRRLAAREIESAGPDEAAEPNA